MSEGEREERRSAPDCLRDYFQSRFLGPRDVGDCALKPLSRIFKVAEPAIAVDAKQAAYRSCVVAMIDSEPLRLAVLGVAFLRAADRAAAVLCGEHCVIV